MSRRRCELPCGFVAVARVAGLCLLVAACDGGGGGGGSSGGSGPAGPRPVYADRYIAASSNIVNTLGAAPTDWPYFFQPNLMLGAPGGILDVQSLGYDPAATNALGGSVVLGFGDAGGHRCIVDGPGADLAVYENPFRTTDALGNAGTENEVATVEVSADLVTWYLFAPTDNTGLPAVETQRYADLAGVTPTNEGGDPFDLADPGITPALPPTFQACYIRITDGGTKWPDYGNTQTDLWDSGADIDAVQALHSVAAPGLSP